MGNGEFLLRELGIRGKVLKVSQKMLDCVFISEKSLGGLNGVQVFKRGPAGNESVDFTGTVLKSHVKVGQTKGKSGVHYKIYRLFRYFIASSELPLVKI